MQSQIGVASVAPKQMTKSSLTDLIQGASAGHNRRRMTMYGNGDRDSPTKVSPSKRGEAI